MDNELLDGYGRMHHGLICQWALSDGAQDTRDWSVHIESGQIVELYPGVGRVAGAPSTRVQRILAAVLAYGPRALASHRSAAWLWGVDRDADDPVDVIVDDRWGRHFQLPGVQLHRPRDRRDLRAVFRNGVPVTPALRMLVDLGAVDPPGVYPALGQVVIARTATPLAVVNSVRRHSRRGRAGVGPLRRALDRYPLDGAAADSWLEIRMGELIRRFGLPPVEFHTVIAGWDVDFLVAGTNVVLECDGRQHLLDPLQIARDARRDEELLAIGYVTVRFTWTEITKTPRKVAQRIVTQLRQWAPHLLPPDPAQ